jgi:hypothetical protein
MATTWPRRPKVTGKLVRDLAAGVQLTLGEARAAALIPQVEMVHAMTDALGGVTLGETAPATSFSPRWSE